MPPPKQLQALFELLMLSFLYDEFGMGFGERTNAGFTVRQILEGVIRISECAQFFILISLIL